MSNSPTPAAASPQRDFFRRGSCLVWENPFFKIRGTILKVPRLRIIVFGGLYWGPLIL